MSPRCILSVSLALSCLVNIKDYCLSLRPRLRVPVPPSCVHLDTEMEKLKQTGAVQEGNQKTTDFDECCYIPHHIASHNGKSCVVFNGFNQYHGQSLNHPDSNRVWAKSGLHSALLA